ncbi:MAG: hypothetical protein K2N14_04415, partial [Clostridia bacterium]|nr:hypothetical protein [Clostridia bacterium]
ISRVGSYLFLTEYVYDEKAASAAGGKVAVKMANDGASWFAPVREGKAFDDGMSEWKQLIYKVAREFHDNFSIIEYKQCDGSGNSDGNVEKSIERVINRLFARRDVTVIKGRDKDKGSEDIYGASVKLELSGTGQSHHVVMCKIYFRSTAAEITPIAYTEAAQINAKLEEAQDNNDPISLSEDSSAKINNTTVNAVRDLVGDAEKFKQCLCFSTRQVLNPDTGRYEDNYDLKTYKALAKRAVSNNAAVTCVSVQVLGISHVKWINDYYEVMFGGKNYLQVVVGFGGSLSLRCVNCGGGDLITSNTIRYFYKDENGIQHKESVTLDLGRDDLGIDDKKLAEIKKYGEFANHLLTVSCNLSGRFGKQCVSCVCRSRMVSVEGIEKCADCPYPEVVYTDYTGDGRVKYLTSNLTFVNDRLSMALTENTEKCKRCGRTFTKQSLTRGQCKLCSGIENLSEDERIKAKKLYAKYKNTISQTVRIRHVFDNKYCLEDETALVFALGNETYVLSKLSFSDDGFIQSPVRIS